MTDLDPVIHAPKRLRIMATLSAVEKAEATFLRDRLELSAPDLSKQMRTLTDAGYVTARRTGRGPGSGTWYRLSRKGRQAFAAHTEALRDLLDGATAAAATSGDGVAEPSPEASPPVQGHATS